LGFQVNQIRWWPLAFRDAWLLEMTIEQFSGNIEWVNNFGASGLKLI
jgi:hypothetical protein